MPSGNAGLIWPGTSGQREDPRARSSLGRHYARSGPIAAIGAARGPEKEALSVDLKRHNRQNRAFRSNPQGVRK